MQVDEVARLEEQYDLVWFTGDFITRDIRFSRLPRRAQGEALAGIRDHRMRGDALWKVSELPGFSVRGKWRAQGV